MPHPSTSAGAPRRGDAIAGTGWGGGTGRELHRRGGPRKEARQPGGSSLGEKREEIWAGPQAPLTCVAGRLGSGWSLP